MPSLRGRTGRAASLTGISPEPVSSADSPGPDLGHGGAPTSDPQDLPQIANDVGVSVVPPIPGPTANPDISNIAAIKGVLRNRAFRRLWYATGLSSLGDWLGLLATTALATSLTTSYQAQNYAFGGVIAVKLLPAIILGPLSGAFADRFDRRRTMVISDALRFGLFLTIPIVHTIAWLLVASFVIECISLFWLPAKDASVPNLVRRDQIESANQLSLITTFGITPVLGAALFSLLSLVTNLLARQLSFFRTNPVNLALYFNAATFLFGAVIVFFIREISGQRTGRPEEQPSILSLIREGAAFMRASPLIRGLIIGLVGAFVGGGTVIGASKQFVQSLGGSDTSYGVLFGAVFVGLGLGMAVGPRIARELSRERLFALSIVFGGVCLAITAVMPQVVLALIFVLGVGFGAGNAYLAGATLMGTEVEDKLRGRVFAMLQALIRVVLIGTLATVPFVVGSVGRNTYRLPWGAHVTIDGTRIVLVAGGAVAVLLGVLAYRVMGDKSRVRLVSEFRAAMSGDSVSRRRMSGGGVFIAFEGGEGAGKSTQIELLAEVLRGLGNEVVVTYEPGATTVGRTIRDLLLNSSEPITPRAEALLFAADRAHHVDTVIRPALAHGDIVLTDRFIDSSLAYQGAGRDLTLEEVRKASRWATDGLRPDLTVVLDLPPEIGLARVSSRGPTDRLERESLEFHERVRRAFTSLAEAHPRHYLVLDATRSSQDIARQVRERVEKLIGVGLKPQRHRVASVDR